MKSISRTAVFTLSLLLLTTALQAEQKPAEDTYLWLEDVLGEKALGWVEAQNKKSLKVLENLPTFKPFFEKNLEIYNSDEQIAYPSLRGEYIYNFWRDQDHVRGILRRTSLQEYRKAEPTWETVLDIDALAESEDENWVYKGNNCLYPEYRHCIVTLSRGGADASVRREFDMQKKAFVKDGFITEESKGGISWIDKNQVLIGSDFGADSMTDSGYPRISKLWTRGTDLSAAKTLFAGDKTDVGIWGAVYTTPEGNYPIIIQAQTFYTSTMHYYHDDKLTAIEIPADADLSSIFKGQMLVRLKTDWNINNNTYPQGSLISIDFDAFMQGSRDFTLVVNPDKRSTISSLSTTRDRLLINMLNNVRSELYAYTFADGQWQNKIVDTPTRGSISVVASSDTSNQVFYSYTGFLSPSTLYFLDDELHSSKVKSLPAFFDASPYIVSQHSVASKDGSQIPYFMVARKDMQLDGTNPVLLYGYGGFEVSMRPSYSATIGVDWLDQGGVYVLANIRGGGEFGPAWHLAALKENRQRAYDDFIAVAENLIQHKVTSPQHLGIRGGSNGGLLMGVMLTQRPDLFNAVVCQVPLLDMQRFNKLLAGASWMGEYGDPDIPSQWDYISKYSPYHNLNSDKSYPKVFFTTSTRDDRVHPAHARKMVAKMDAMGIPLYYYENTEGGHAGASNKKQSAYLNALIYSYLLDQLK
ncbi:MAG: prolyl oligopeptidase family serine peptidase [Xanthomonadales bacterium]|nr:prolyl oligopeptidase family serine peptidase [Xanthomonadales bacterium]